MQGDADGGSALGDHHAIDRARLQGAHGAVRAHRHALARLDGAASLRLDLNGAQHGNRKRLIGWLSATVLCGLFFVGMQVYEFYHFYHKGLGYTTNLFGSSFYTLTGFHGTHVTIGVIWLATILVLALRGKLPPAKALNLELAALYWHFVDVVWIVIFPVVYLMR